MAMADAFRASVHATFSHFIAHGLVLWPETFQFPDQLYVFAASREAISRGKHVHSSEPFQIEKYCDGTDGGEVAWSKAVIKGDDILRGVDIIPSSAKTEFVIVEMEKKISFKKTLTSYLEHDKFDPSVESFDFDCCLNSATFMSHDVIRYVAYCNIVNGVVPLTKFIPPHVFFSYDPSGMGYDVELKGQVWKVRNGGKEKHYVLRTWLFSKVQSAGFREMFMRLIWLSAGFADIVNCFSGKFFVNPVESQLAALKFLVSSGIATTDVTEDTVRDCTEMMSSAAIIANYSDYLMEYMRQGYPPESYDID
jgi:hypothetical protein